MKPIPGYEIVRGDCYGCDLLELFCSLADDCLEYKIYKKKEEPNTIETIEDAQEVNISINGQKVGKKNMRKIKGYRIVKADDCCECDFYKKIRHQKLNTIIDIICSHLCQDCKRGLVYKKNKRAKAVIL